MTTNNLNKGNSGHFELNQPNNQNGLFNLNQGTNNYYCSRLSYYTFPFVDTWLTAYPEVNVLVSKNRKKKFDNKIYLDNLQEFELEIYNPSTSNLGILIELNGSLISQNHLIIKPGQRLFLDRYIDTNNKFVFNTYDVDNTESSKTAIANNGKLEISFYKEKQYNDYTINSPSIMYCNYSSNIGINTTSIGTTASYNADDIVQPIGDKVETGRIEKGGLSNQSFVQTNMNFHDTSSYLETFQLLPISQKPLEPKDLIKHCTQCSYKLKKEWKFCPNCKYPTSNEKLTYMKVVSKKDGEYNTLIHLLEDFELLQPVKTNVTIINFKFDEKILENKSNIEFIQIGTLEQVNKNSLMYRIKDFIIKSTINKEKIELIY